MGFKFFTIGELADKLAAESGFAGTDITDDYIETTPHPKGKFQLLQAFEMLAGSVEKIRIRRVGKRLFIEIEYIEIIHSKNPLFVRRTSTPDRD